MQTPLPQADGAALLRQLSILRADHVFGAHAAAASLDCPLCPNRANLADLDQRARLAAHEAGDHRATEGGPRRDCGYCAVYVLRPIAAAPIARPARPLALPAPRRLEALPAAPVLLALPYRASVRYIHREAWLAALRDALRPAFLAAGAPIPAAVRVTCGFPSSGARSAKRRVIGQCHYQTADRVPDLSVSPVLDDPETVAATLVHELIHATAPTDGHGSRFGKAARALGLVGSLTQTTAGPVALALLAPILAQLGAYPHSRIDLSAVKRQGTRMLLVKCPDTECGYQVRTTAKWLAIGVPTCPCGELMQAEDAAEDDGASERQAATVQA